MPIWINACDLFVLPSLDEGSPTVIPEAWGCGIPVVATAVGGVPELFQSNNIGILVEPRNSEDLASAILSALQTRWDSRCISDYACLQYTWKCISNEIIDVYAKLVG